MVNQGKRMVMWRRLAPWGLGLLLLAASSLAALPASATPTGRPVNAETPPTPVAAGGNQAEHPVFLPFIAQGDGAPNIGLGK